MALAKLERAQQSAREKGLEQTHVSVCLIDRLARKLGIPEDAQFAFKVDRVLRDLERKVQELEEEIVELRKKAEEEA